TLGAREQKLLASLPLLLEQRFEQVCRADATVDEPAHSVQPTGDATQGVALFLRDMRALLLAELDMRMQPARGLVDAYNSELK
ncbi:MAG: DUF3348 domain-containing protein, partial [Burkholderiales bacterium]|nr:DUF3348 domain-containing protein [Burkholderiales bacterium]